MTRKRVVHHPGAAWVAAVAGAWLVAAACRTMQGAVASAPAPTAVAVPEGPAASVAEPVIRVGIRVAVEAASVAAPGGVVVRGRAPGEAGAIVRTLPRATFRSAEAGRVLLVETGDRLELATAWPAAAGELVRVDDAAYRGVLEVRPAEEGTLTVVNSANLEDYLRGVVPNELSPQAFPHLEALKAQAVAARTYALAHLRDYASKGFDVCATPSCQVYRGQESEHPLADRAVRETAGVVATWRGRPINAYYTSTCGGHTEDGGAIFDDAAPYLKGVSCQPERASRHVVRTTASPRPDLAGEPDAAHVLALLEALGVVQSEGTDASWLAAPVAAAEVRVWAQRAEGLLAPAERGGLLRPEEAERLDDPALARSEALALLAGAIERSRAPALAQGELAGVGDGQLSVLHGEAADSHPIDPAALLFRDVRGTHSAASELALSVGDRVSYVERGGRVVYLEAGSDDEDGAHGVSRHYRWEVRLRPEDVARTLARYGRVGQVRDIVPKRLGVSGRVVELGVVGSEGELALKGLKVRWGLGLRENLFVVERERDASGNVRRFVITGKGWGHGVGLCQVGSFGMAQAGSTFEEILGHYYTGVTVAPRSPRPLL